MKIALERHQYAPELNKAHVMHRGRVMAVLPAPGVTSIQQARAVLGRAANPAYRYFVDVYTVHAAPHASLDREFHGFARSLAEVLEFVRGQRGRVGALGTVNYRVRLFG